MASQNSNSKKGGINIELLLGLSATFLSLAALVVSIFQTKIAREQQQASVWPYLQISTSNDKNSFRLNIENKGIGPAIIKGTACYYDTIKYKDPAEFFRERIGKHEKGVGLSTMSPGTVFAPGEDMNLIGVWGNDSVATKLVANMMNPLFGFSVIYSDVYGNCWQLDDEKTSKLKKCPD